MIDSHGLYLLIAAATSVVVLILLIAVVKLNPFLSLLTVSLALAVATGMRLETIVGSFEPGQAIRWGISRSWLAWAPCWAR